MAEKERRHQEIEKREQREQREEREEQITRILKRVEEQLRRELPEGPQTLEEIEQQVEKVGEEIKREIQREVLDAQGTGYSGTKLSCACGSEARYRGDVVRSLITLQGEQAIARAYYYCSFCRHGFYPLDRVLGLGHGQCSVGVAALACASPATCLLLWPPRSWSWSVAFVCRQAACSVWRRRQVACLLLSGRSANSV